LTPERIKLDLEAGNRFSAIKELATLVFKSEQVSDKVDFLNSILLREEIESTAVYPLIALPHGVTDTIERLVVALGVSPKGVDFQSGNGLAVRIVIMIAIPRERYQEYLQLLSRLTAEFKGGVLADRILAARTPQEVMEALEEAEAGANLGARGRWAATGV
jgi:mannitol/fructose-specific phosphotransferase system IIA component (Ntr-type)